MTINCIINQFTSLFDVFEVARVDFWYLLEEILCSISLNLFLNARIFNLVYMWFIKVCFIIRIFWYKGQISFGCLFFFLKNNVSNRSFTFMVTNPHTYTWIVTFILFFFFLFILLLINASYAVSFDTDAILNWALYIVLWTFRVTFEEFIFIIFIYNFHLHWINNFVKFFLLKRTLTLLLYFYALFLIACTIFFFLVYFLNVLCALKGTVQLID